MDVPVAMALSDEVGAGGGGAGTGATGLCRPTRCSNVVTRGLLAMAYLTSGLMATIQTASWLSATGYPTVEARSRVISLDTLLPNMR